MLTSLSSKSFSRFRQHEKPEYNGVQLINSKVIVSYLKQLLRNDLQYAPFEMVAMEKPVAEKITIQTDKVRSPSDWEEPSTVWMPKTPPCAS